MTVRRVSLTLALLLTSMVVANPLAQSQQPRVAQTAKQVSRCATFRSVYGPIGVYITKGHVSCREGRKDLKASLEGKGTPFYSGGIYEGWYCGGQMGYYFCKKPVSKASKEAVGQACDVPHVGCPARLTLTPE
jgi:hypothetical protein